jgi:acetoin utilization protein AcuC
MARSGFVYSDDYLLYRFSQSHPLRQVRLQMNKRLLEAYGLFENGQSDLVEPVSATEDDLLLVHTPEYIAALRDLSAGRTIRDPGTYGLGPGDNPAFPGMYEATLLYVGATKEAVRRIVAGENTNCFSNSGGLHHAMPARGAGFCLANDCSLAAKWLIGVGFRVAYLDIDAHHGDGVQHMFYDDSSILTISLHETPDTLFPYVTGFVDEIGEGDGMGFNANVPMLSRSTDEHYQYAFDEFVNPLLSAYKPTAIILNVGADGHFDDPLTHLALTSRGWLSMVQQTLSFGAPVLAVGGGGYNINTVARLWTLLQAELSNVELPDVVPEDYAKQYGITNLHDRSKPELSQSVKDDCWDNVREKVARLKQSVLPLH